MFTLTILENNQYYTITESSQKIVEVLCTYFGNRIVFVSYEGA
jgi:hypothetical protein